MLLRSLGKHNLRDKTFIGLDVGNRPIFLTQFQRLRHVEILGVSGVGKTSSVILPMIFQDICEEKSILSMDGKGDIEFAEAVYASLLIKEDFKRELSGENFKIPFLYLNPSMPDLSNTYNPVYTHPKTDLNLLTERVFRAFQITHEHWGPLGLDMLRFLIRALYGTGKQFNLADIYVCLESQEARESLFKETNDRGAVQELKWKFDRRSREDAFAQFKVKLSELNTSILTDYNPDIIPEELLRVPSVLCISLPESYKTLSYGIGNMLMEDYKVGVAKRFSETNKNYPTSSIFLDESQYFLNPKVKLSALTQFRAANCQLTFSHHTRHDLRVYDYAVADSVWFNSQTKIVLPVNDPETYQLIADTIGTEKTITKTVRSTQGPFMTDMPTFEASNQLVDAYETHPNIFKKLRPVGQAVVMSTVQMDDKKIRWACTPVNLAPFPENIRHPLPLPTKVKRNILEGLHYYEKFAAG